MDGDQQLEHGQLDEVRAVKAGLQGGWAGGRGG